jgi:hypothetical protein
LAMWLFPFCECKVIIFFCNCQMFLQVF